MAVKRREVVRYFEENGFYLLREGKKHSIYTNKVKTIPIKRIAPSTTSLQTNSASRPD